MYGQQSGSMLYIEKLAYNWTTTIELIILKTHHVNRRWLWKKISWYIWCNINVICYRRHSNCPINVKYMYMLINFFQIPWDLVPNEARHQIKWRGKRLTKYMFYRRNYSFIFLSICCYSIHIIPIIYYILPNQGIYIYKYDVLYVIGLVHPCQVIICALGQVTCIR